MENSYDDELKKKTNREIRQIKRLLIDCGVTTQKIKVIAPLIENVAWMKVKLDEARETIKASSIAIPYDNGGGQKGLRENPLFSGYEKLFGAYSNGMNQIMRCTPKDETRQQAEAPQKTVLQLVREKNRKEA